MAAALATLVVRRTPRPGREGDLDRWLHDAVAAAARFPGHLGATVLQDGRDRILVVRWADSESLAGWDASPERAEAVARAEELCEPTSVREVASGVESWFTLPEAGPAPPPKWKMVVVGFAVAFPLIQVYSALAGWLLAAWPPLLRGAAVGLVMIATMTYVAMPAATRLTRRWLYPARGRSTL
jgi:hypothetical protein